MGLPPRRGGKCLCDFGLLGETRGRIVGGCGPLVAVRCLVGCRRLVVLATGAWLNQLARPFGVRMPVQAGRGYSLSVKTDEPVAAPIYLPTARVACTPYRDGLRIGGTMEFRSADHPLVPARVDALLSSARPWLSGVQWRTVSDFWVGPRPVSADGMPLIGATRSAKVFVAGGHGMWGVTLGPVTGKLLASQIVSGRSPDALSAFNPLR